MSRKQWRVSGEYLIDSNVKSLRSFFYNTKYHVSIGNRFGNMNGATNDLQLLSIYIWN